jgi:hypothetical protein
VGRARRAHRARAPSPDRGAALRRGAIRADVDIRGVGDEVLDAQDVDDRREVLDAQEVDDQEVLDAQDVDGRQEVVGEEVDGEEVVGEEVLDGEDVDGEEVVGEEVPDGGVVDDRLRLAPAGQRSNGVITTTPGRSLPRTSTTTGWPTAVAGGTKARAIP